MIFGGIVVGLMIGFGLGWALRKPEDALVADLKDKIAQLEAAAKARLL